MNRLTLTLLLGFVVCCGSAHADVAAYESSGVEPGSTYVYAQYGNGDVVFRLRNNASTQCVGFWLRPSFPGYNLLADIVVAATTRGQTLRVYADDEFLWPGSPTPYCIVYAISLE